MLDDVRVKYLFVNLTLKNYLRLQAGVLVVCTGVFLALLLYRDHSNVILANAWWVFLALIVCELIESIFAISRALREHAKKQG